MIAFHIRAFSGPGHPRIPSWFYVVHVYHSEQSLGVNHFVANSSLNRNRGSLPFTKRLKGLVWWLNLWYAVTCTTVGSDTMSGIWILMLSGDVLLHIWHYFTGLLAQGPITSLGNTDFPSGFRYNYFEHQTVLQNRTLVKIRTLRKPTE